MYRLAHTGLYVVYVRPLVENDSIIWSSFTVKDTEAIESVQRRFTKRLSCFKLCCACKVTQFGVMMKMIAYRPMLKAA